MSVHVAVQPLIALIAGILILIVPRLLNYVVAILSDHRRSDRPCADAARLRGFADAASAEKSRAKIMLSLRKIFCARVAMATVCACVCGMLAETAQAAPDVPLEFHPMEHAPPGTTLPFSEAVRAGDMLYLSGQIGLDASGKVVAGGIKAETKQTMDNIGEALAHYGSSFDRIAQCTVALADMADWPAFNEVYRGYFKEHFPARMAFGANALALGARVEVQCNAVVGKKR